MEKTKVEELKQEAEIYSYRLYHSKAWNPGEDMLVKAYLASAEPREKQIQIDAEQIRALQKQNGELTDKVREFEKENAELKMRKRMSECEEYCNTFKYACMQLTKAKELLAEWLQTSKASSCDNINIVTDTEQFLKESE